MSLRHALFWSLAAHVFVLLPLTNDRAVEPDAAGSALAVTIAKNHALPRILPRVSAPLLPVITPKSVASNNTMAMPNRQNQTLRSDEAPTPVVTSLPATSVPKSVAVVDADGLRHYRLALAREMRRAWTYPQQALIQKWEGTTEIRLELLAGGRFANARIEKSSGHQALDEAALKIISSAASAAPVPNSLLGEPISIVLPVLFSVASENRNREN